ncbi:hypothetical protein XENTR_v10009713 [Xenopus tropicalis]|nr:hypothetical protein XENTR_v10009713 [Xenopus tropicalis]
MEMEKERGVSNKHRAGCVLFTWENRAAHTWWNREIEDTEYSRRDTCITDMDLTDLQEVENEFLLTLDDFIPPHLQRNQRSPAEHKESSVASEQISRTTVSPITQEVPGSPGQRRERHWIRFDGIGPTDKDGMPFASRSSVDKPRDWYRSMFRVLHRLSDSDDSDNDSKEKETPTLHIPSKSGPTDPKQRNHNDTVGHRTTTNQVPQGPSRTFSPNSRELERSQSFTLRDPKRTISPVPRAPEGTLYFPTTGSPKTISVTSRELQRTPSLTSREQQKTLDTSSREPEQMPGSPPRIPRSYLSISPEQFMLSNPCRASETAPRSLLKDSYATQTFTSGVAQTLNSSSTEPQRTLFSSSSRDPKKTHNFISSEENRTVNPLASTTSSSSTPSSFRQSSRQQLSPGLSNQGTNSTFERKPLAVSSKTSREPQQEPYSTPVPLSPGLESQQFCPPDIESLFSHCFSIEDKVHSSDSAQMEPTSPISPNAKKAKSSTSKALEKLEAELKLFNAELNRDLVDHRHTPVYTSYMEAPMPKSPPLIGGSQRTVDTPSASEEKPLARAVVKFDFSAESPKELSLQRGTTVLILKKVDKNWMLGQQDGRRGLFPESYVRVLVPGESVQPVEPHLSGVAVYDFKAESDAELSLSKVSHGFTPTENATCVQAVAPNSTQAPAGTIYRVLYAYTPNNQDELHLIPGDTVTVSQRCDDGWFVGECPCGTVGGPEALRRHLTHCCFAGVCWRTKRFGTFPGNFVAPV